MKPEKRFRIELNGLLGSLAGSLPDMLILGNPNNPTGAVIPPEILSEIVTACTRRRIHFVVDESFIDFTSHRSLARLASQGRYLLVLRSFTKFFALPGLRIGYLVAYPSTVETLSRELEPWSVNALAIIAAAEAIKDSAFREKSLALIARERHYLTEGLVKLGCFDPYPSEANFLLVRITKRHIDFDKVTEADFDAVVNVHFKGVYFLTQKLLPLMNDGGRIVNISSGLTRISVPGSSAYAAAKGGIEVLTRYLAKELGPRRITADVVAPGPVQTDFSGGVVRDNPEVNKTISTLTALVRPGVPDDVGR